MIPHVVVDTALGLNPDRLRSELAAVDATVSVEPLETESAVMASAVDAEAVVVDDPAVFSKHSLTSMPDLEVVVLAGRTADGIDLDAAAWAGVTVLALPFSDVDDAGERTARLGSELRAALGDGDPSTVVEG